MFTEEAEAARGVTDMHQRPRSCTEVYQARPANRAADVHPGSGPEPVDAGTMRLEPLRRAAGPVAIRALVMPRTALPRPHLRLDLHPRLLTDPLGQHTLHGQGASHSLPQPPTAGNACAHGAFNVPLPNAGVPHDEGAPTGQVRVRAL